MRAVQRAELDNLLVHIVRCREVADRAIAKIKLDDFNEATERDHRLIFCAVKDCIVEHGAMPGPAAMDVKLAAYTSVMPEMSDPHILEGLYTLAAQCYEFDAKQLLPSLAYDILQSFLLQRQVHVFLNDMQERNMYSPAAIVEAANRVNSALVSQGAISNPFKDELLGAVPREPTGVNFIDQMMGGGTRPREMYGFLAPSGGGKTTLSNQIAITSARMRRHVVVFSYEEAITPEYMVPLYACATGLTRERLEKVTSLNDLNPEERAVFVKAKADTGEYLHCVDCSGHAGASGARGGFGGPPEIESTLLLLKSRGIHVSGFVVDWFWPMFQRYWSAWEPEKSGTGKRVEERAFAQQVTDQLKVIASRFDCWAWVNQQLTPAEAMKKRDMNWNDSAEFKSFAWYMNGCFALGMLDESKVGVLNYSKGRSVKTSKQPIFLDGLRARFESRNDDLIYDGRQNKYVPVKERNAVPKEEAPSSVRANYEGREAGSLGV
jgi:hypothetical protein